MGNTISSTSGFRSCGLCYFKLPAGTPFLDQPRVSRKALPVWPQPEYEEGWLDEVLRPQKGIKLVSMKMELGAIRKSSGRGCIGCAAIIRCLEDQLRDRGFVLDDKCWDSQCGLSWLVGDRKSHDSSLHIELQVLERHNEAIYKKSSFAMMIGYTHRNYFHPGARKVSPSVALGYTGSPASLQTIKTWLENCESSHMACKQPVCTLPYRVVELSKDARGETVFRLVQGLERQEAYACLSHRWSLSTHRCRTTKLTLASHLEQVPTNKLPKTFREAGEVAMYLGLQYIWIDSLCIIQDDEEDWKTQAAQMCNIYSGSYVTIAATSSSDSDNGLFHTISRIPISPVESNRGDLYIRQANPHVFRTSSSPFTFADYPLLTRSWVYQERLLSPRLIHFTRYENIFECLSHNASCDCGQNAFTVSEGKHRLQSTLSSSTSLSDVRMHWNEMVTAYSSLHLTFAKDSLPALAGIARLYGTRHREMLGRYVAGLWEHTLIYDMLWYVATAVSSTRAPDSPVPSWSWASVTGDTLRLLYARTAAADLDVVGFRFELAGPDEFGPVRHAEMTVRGFLAKGTWKAMAGSSSGGLRTWYRPDAGPGTTEYEMHADYKLSDGGSPKRLDEGCAVFCLKTGFVGDGCHVCLILRSLDEERTAFERIGLLLTAPKEAVDAWYEDGQAMETLKLL